MDVNGLERRCTSCGDNCEYQTQSDCGVLIIGLPAWPRWKAQVQLSSLVAITLNSKP